MKVFRPILSIAFSLLVLFSGSRMMVGIHYCGGRAQDISLFSPAEKCGMETKMPPCPRHEAKSCCEDETIVHDSQDIQHTFHQLSLAIPFFVELPVTSVVLAEIIPASSLFQIQPDGYDPPGQVCDRTIAQQVFRI